MSGKDAPDWLEREGNKEWRAGYAGDRARIEERERRLLENVKAALNPEHEARFGRVLERVFLHGEFPDTQLVVILGHWKFPGRRFGFTRWLWDDPEESTMLEVTIGEDAQDWTLARAVRDSQGDQGEVIWVYPPPWSGGEVSRAPDSG